MSFTQRGLPVGDVAGVVDPGQLVVAPPRGDPETHMEAVLSFRCRVPPAEPIPWDFCHPLFTNETTHVKHHVDLF